MSDLRWSLAPGRGASIESLRLSWAGLGFGRRALLVALATGNTVLALITIAGFFLSAGAGHDWGIYVEAGRRVISGGLFEWDSSYAWSYSPLLAYLFAVLTPIGYVGWSILHFAAVAALRDRWLVLITLVSWPFWADLYNGNTMTFVFVAAALALQRNGIGAGTYLLMCLLMPRPLMLPVMVWLLWRQPEWRLRFAVMVSVAGALVIATGQAAAWLRALTTVSDAVAASTRDIGPAVVLGGWWLIVGAILAIVLTIRGRLGLASLAASPYWLPQYLVMVILEAVPGRSSRIAPDRPAAIEVKASSA